MKKQKREVPIVTATSQYALQATVFLAEHFGEQPVTGKRIAAETGVPRKYLSAILSSLVRQGLLSASRGINGGYGLARRPAEILLFDVLNQFEPVLWKERPCPFGNDACNDQQSCEGHKYWKKVREAYLEFVHHTTLQDVMPKKKKKPSSRPGRRRNGP